MAKKKTTPAPAGNTALAVVDEDLLDMGTGLEDAGTEDYAIPFLKVLQALSPQLNPRKGEYVEGADQGMFYNTVTKEVFDGESTGVEVIPVLFNKKWLEWYPRDSKLGSGLVQIHDSKAILEGLEKNDKGNFETDHGTYIAETVQMFVLLLSGGAVQRCLVSLTGSAIGMSRTWNSIMVQKPQIERQDGTLVPSPIFMYKYTLKTVPRTNDQGDWFGWTVDGSEALTAEEAPLARAAGAWLRSLRTNMPDLTRSHDLAEGGSSENESKDDIPF